MKNLNYEKRKRNGIITSIIITFLILLIAALCIMLIVSPIKFAIKIPLIFLVSIIAVIICPGLLFKFQFVIYDYLNRNIDIVTSTLTSDFKVIYLKDINCLKKSAIPLHLQRTYMAKLEDDGTITIRIETEGYDEVFEQQTTDYSWFLSLFSLEE